MPFVRSPGRRGGRRWPSIAIGAVTVAGLLLLVVGLAVRLDTASGAPAPTRFGRTPEVAALPGAIGLHGWNNAAFVNDNLWTEGNRQFAVWVDGRGNPIAGRREGEGAKWHTADLGRLAGNPLAAPTAPDHHRVYVIAVDRAGYVHVAGNMHGDPLRYVRSERPFDIDSWVRPGMVGSEERSVTYPAFVRAPGGELLFFYRDGGAGHGDVLLNRVDGSTGRWRRVATLIDGRSSGESPYLQRIAVDSARGAIHVVFLWRSGDSAATNRDPSYLRSDDGGTTWRASDRSPVELPVTHRTADVVALKGNGSMVLLNSGGLAVDADGRPHAVFRVHSGGSSGSDILHVWQDRDGWRAEPVPGTGDLVGRPTLVGGGHGPLLMLWTERGGGGRSTLRLTGMDGRHSDDHASLARLPVTDWEPTFDSVAMKERSQLRMLLPLRRTTGREPAARAAVVTWPLATLADNS